VNSFQSGNVIRTIFEIENLDLHSFQTFLMYLPNGPSAKQATAVIPKTTNRNTPGRIGTRFNAESATYSAASK
jgi:hypothetical protein